MSTLAPFPGAEVADLHLLVPFYQAILDTLPIAVGVFEMISRTDFRVTFMNLHSARSELHRAGYHRQASRRDHVRGNCPPMCEPVLGLH